MKKVFLRGFSIFTLTMLIGYASVLSASDHRKEKSDHYNEESDSKYYSSSSSSTNIILPQSYTPNDGRLLGSQCAQCHGTNGISTNEWDSIAGEDELEEEMYEDEEPIMSAQAKGYTSGEVSLMSDWLRTLKNNKGD